MDIAVGGGGDNGRERRRIRRRVIRGRWRKRERSDSIITSYWPSFDRVCIFAESIHRGGATWRSVSSPRGVTVRVLAGSSQLRRDCSVRNP